MKTASSVRGSYLTRNGRVRGRVRAVAVTAASHHNPTPCGASGTGGVVCSDICQTDTPGVHSHDGSPVLEFSDYWDRRHSVAT